MFESFPWWTALLGGALIGIGASIYLLVHGRVAGISGLLGSIVAAPTSDAWARRSFLLGLVAAGVAALLIAPRSLGASPASLPVLALAGLLVGVGTRLGRGCTSGHGVCGISSGSSTSLWATAVFVATGVAVATGLALLGIGS